MAGINLGFTAGEILLCNSCFRKSESGVPPYVALHSTSPSFFTAHRNMTSASFWPFLTNSCSSIRLTNAVGPCPINTGRNIGSPDAGFDGVPLACAAGVALVCAQARSTTNSKAIRTDPITRMARYASGARRFFKGDFAKVYVPSGCLSRPFLDWYAPCVDPRGVIERTLDRTAIAETRDPSSGLKHILRGVADSETRWLFRAYFQVLLISICIRRDREHDPNILRVNYCLVRSDIVMDCSPVGRILHELWRDKIISFCDVVMVHVHVNTQVRLAIRHNEHHRADNDDFSAFSVVNRWNEMGAQNGG